MEGICEERFWREWEGVEKNQRPILVTASPQTTGINRRATIIGVLVRNRPYSCLSYKDKRQYL